MTTAASDGQARSGLLQGISRPHSRLHRLRRTVPDPKARVQRTSARAARSLAPWPTPRTPQVMSPRSSTRSLPWMMTRCSSTIRTTISPTSRKPTNENTRQISVPTVFESSVSQRSHDDFALQVESKESMQSGNRC